MVQRARLVQWVFKGWVLRKGDGSKRIEPCVPMIHLFWETKRPLLFTVIIVFFWQAFEGNGCKYMNGTQGEEGRRPFTHSYSSQLSPFSLTFTLPLQMPATQISVFGNTCVLSIPSLCSNHCYWYGNQNTNHASEQADWSWQAAFDLLTQNFPPLWIIAVEVICSLHCCHFRCTNLYNKNSSV